MCSCLDVGIAIGILSGELGQPDRQLTARTQIPSRRLPLSTRVRDGSMARRGREPWPRAAGNESLARLNHAVPGWRPCSPAASAWWCTRRRRAPGDAVAGQAGRQCAIAPGPCRSCSMRARAAAALHTPHPPEAARWHPQAARRARCGNPIGPNLPRGRR